MLEKEHHWLLQFGFQHMKSSKLVKGCLEALILLLSNMTEIKKNIYEKFKTFIIKRRLLISSSGPQSVGQWLTDAQLILKSLDVSVEMSTNVGQISADHWSTTGHILADYESAYWSIIGQDVN